MVEVKIIVGICVMVYLGIEVHKDVNITLLIKSGCEYGAKGIEFPHLVLLAQGIEFMDVVVDKMHTTRSLSNYKVNGFSRINVQIKSKYANIRYNGGKI